MVYVIKGTSPSTGNNIHLMQDVTKFRGVLRKRSHINLPKDTYSPSEMVYVINAPHLQQKTIFTLCRTYPNSEMVYVIKGTSPSAGNNIHVMQGVFKFGDGLVIKGTSFSSGKNIHLMQEVSKFRDGLRNQRHLTFIRKQYSPYAGRIQIPRWST